MGCLQSVMLHTIKAQFEAALGPIVGPALAQRLTLVFNHVLAAEPVATDRLRAYSGRTIRLELHDWPALLPSPPELAWRITPAGLLEWAGEAVPPAPADATAGGSGAADLRVRLDASNPAMLFARTVAGEVPQVQIEGDAQLAGEVNWLLQNLRWDVAADLERLFGPAVAQQLHQVGKGLKAGVQAAVKGANQLRSRWRNPG